jgi:hypothetical protein
MEKGRESNEDRQLIEDLHKLLGCNPFHGRCHGEACGIDSFGGVVEAKSQGCENSIGSKSSCDQPIAPASRTREITVNQSLREKLIEKTTDGGSQSDCPKSIHSLFYDVRHLGSGAGALPTGRGAGSQTCERNNIAIKQVTNHQGIMIKRTFILIMLGTNIGYIR